MNREPSKTRAFTLVELLVVIGILAVLVALLLPALSRAAASARSVRCAANLKQIGVAFSSYTMAYQGWLPPVNSYAAHMATASGFAPTDWAIAKDYGMWNALGQFLGYPEFGGVKDPAGVSPAPDDVVYTGYVKWGSYWGSNADGGKKFRKSVFYCPELRSYPDSYIGPFAGAGYGESTYLQKTPSGPGSYNVPSTGGTPGHVYGKTTNYGLPRPVGAIKNPSQAIAVSEKGGFNSSTSPKFLPQISDLTVANYPARKVGSPNDDFDMYRHSGGCNILFADGHVAYYKGSAILATIVKDVSSTSQRNYMLP